jgi:hypothetical protein
MKANNICFCIHSIQFRARDSIDKKCAEKMQREVSNSDQKPCEENMERQMMVAVLHLLQL